MHLTSYRIPIQSPDTEVFKFYIGSFESLIVIIYIRESYSPQSDLHIIFLNQKSIVFKYNLLTFFKNPFILFLHKKSIWMLYHFIEQMEYLQIFYYETSELDQVAWQDGSYWFLIPNTLKKPLTLTVINQQQKIWLMKKIFNWRNWWFNFFQRKLSEGFT